jgi:hypothetical protein
VVVTPQRFGKCHNFRAEYGGSTCVRDNTFLIRNYVTWLDKGAAEDTPSP